MADDEKKGGLSVLLGLGKPKDAAGDGADDMNEPDEGDEDLMTIASELSDAFQSQDPKAIVEALNAYLDARGD